MIVSINDVFNHATESKDKAEWIPSVDAPAHKERFLLRPKEPKRSGQQLDLRLLRKDPMKVGPIA